VCGADAPVLQNPRVAPLTGSLVRQLPKNPQPTLSTTTAHSKTRASSVPGCNSSPKAEGGANGCIIRVVARVATATTAGTRGLAGKTCSNVAAAATEAKSKKEPKKICGSSPKRKKLTHEIMESVEGFDEFVRTAGGFKKPIHCQYSGLSARTGS